MSEVDEAILNLDARVQKQFLADIESLDSLHTSIKVLLTQIVDTLSKNRYRISERDWWEYGLRLVQNLKKVEIIGDSKKEILVQIKKMILATS